MISWFHFISCRALLMVCLSIATHRVLSYEVADEAMVREIIRTNLGGIMTNFMKYIQRFQMFVSQPSKRGGGGGAHQKVRNLHFIPQWPQWHLLPIKRAALHTAVYRNVNGIELS